MVSSPWTAKVVHPVAGALGFQPDLRRDRSELQFSHVISQGLHLGYLAL